MPDLPACRSCGGSDLEIVLSLGKLPLPDALVGVDGLDRVDDTFPLDVAFCPTCTLVQLVDEVPPERLFVDNYLYFSSYSDHVLAHSRDHVAALVRDRGLGHRSLVVELASNDGYLLRNVVERGVGALGIDPAPGQAAAAAALGIPTLAEFFGPEVATRLRDEGRRADVIIANNVMAHVPDLNGFVEGMRILLADDGLITIENPWVVDLVERTEFDTIYHEHLCYFSCTAVDALMRRHGLHLNDVEYFPTLHGGTLRWHCGHHDRRTPRAESFLAQERRLGVTSLAWYAGFAERVRHLTLTLRALIEHRAAAGRRIAAYGAAAKGAILLNAVGLGPELIDFVVDRNPHKQGLHMPGVHLPIRSPQALLDEQPDDLLVLAWNFADEVMAQQAEYRRRGGRFIIPIPTPVVR